MTGDTRSISKTYYDGRFGGLSQELNEEERIRWGAISSALAGLGKKNLAIADFGCGRGWLSHKLAAFGQVTGFDISERSVENARRSFPAINFVCLDASEPVPADHRERFDLVVSSEVLEHLEDQPTYLANINTLLKNDGRLLLTTPNGLWHDVFYRDGREKWKQPVENWVNLERLTALVTEAGLNPYFSTSFQSEWIFGLRPPVKKALSNPLSRKALKALGLYGKTLERLNKNLYGLNLIMLAIKKNG